jgi:hypothetical protein
MSNNDQTSPDRFLPDRPTSDTTSAPTHSGQLDDSAPPPPAPLPDWSAAVMTATQRREPKVRRVLTRAKCRTIVTAAMLLPMIGLSVGLLESPSASATQPASSEHSAGAPRGSGGGSNARSGPSAGGSSGTVGNVSKSVFTIATSAGQKVTIDETSSTKYKKGSSSIAGNSVKKGERVLVLGTVSSTTIKATQVIVQSTGTSKSVASTAATVIPFTKGAPTTSKQVGQIPSSYSEGSGTIVSGTTATKATEAALAAYPGGVVDRVVKLSNGEYEVHQIGVNWPHHVFVNQDFKVIGAE